MEAPNLYNQVRPTSFAEVVGQQTAVNVLEAQVARKPRDRSHAMLFSGPSGCGKTTLARILRDELGCIDADYEEINAAKSRGIDDIREIQARIGLRPMGGRCRVWVIDEAHQLTKDAQTAMLKTLEDTPVHAYFILCTTDPQKLIGTIKTRCLEVQVVSLPKATLKGLVASTAASISCKLPDAVANAIADAADGSARRAVQLLDQVRDLDDEDAMLDAIAKGDCRTAAIEIARLLYKPGGSWADMARLLKGLGDEDVEGIRHMVLSYGNSILLNGKTSSRVFNVMLEFQRNFYDTKKVGLTIACYAAMNPA